MLPELALPDLHAGGESSQFVGEISKGDRLTTGTHLPGKTPPKVGH